MSDKTIELSAAEEEARKAMEKARVAREEARVARKEAEEAVDGEEHWRRVADSYEAGEEAELELEEAKRILEEANGEWKARGAQTASKKTANFVWQLKN